MSLKEHLTQLCDIRKEIKDLEARINKLELASKDEVSDIVEATTMSFPIIRTHKKIKGIDLKQIKKLEYLTLTLENRYDKLLDIQTHTIEFIERLPTSRLRLIFTYRYIDNFSWIKISNLIGNGATEDSIRKEHDRFLEKNDICPFCPGKL